nr:MAG TPA: hypothetical protein [Bacteriophage sp.]
MILYKNTPEYFWLNLDSQKYSGYNSYMINQNRQS